MKRLTVLLALLCLFPLAACARSEPLVDVRVVDLDGGGSLEAIGHAGRDYIEGQPGHRFAVSLVNTTGARVLAVLSVDGVNAISGQTAGTSQAGYVLEPWQQVEIRGWRKSTSDIAEFYFTDLPDSYAARTGRPQNVGVIGVAAFRERRVAEPMYYPSAPMIGRESERAADSASGGIARRDEARAPSASANGGYGKAAEASEPSLARQQIGTGHGARRYDPVTQTVFERESNRPNQQVAIFYDSYDALVSRGVIRHSRHDRQPDAFPIGFAPDPYQ